MRVAAVPTSSTSLGPKILLSPYWKYRLHHGCSPPSRSARRQHFIRCSIKTRAAEHFGESDNLSTYITALADSIGDSSAEQIKKFPWKKASSIAAKRLLILGQKGLKWSLVLLFAFSFLSDVIMAISRSRELMIPLGLFTGITLADFLKESSQEFFKRTIKEERIPVQLLGPGSFFVFIKFLSLCLNVQWRILLSHIGNGGLMQILWLAREMKQTVNGDVHEDEVLGSEN